MTAHARSRAGWWWLAALAITVVVVVAASFWASADPDGLERIAEDLGFLQFGESAPYEILPDYTVPGIEGPFSTILAGLIGVSVVLLLISGLGYLLARRRS